MPRSPKGLITNRSLTPEEMAQLGEQTPNVFQEINEQLAFWRRFAKSYIEPNPATDGTLDRTAAAKALLNRLRVIECSLNAAERIAPSSGLYMVAVCHALLLPSHAHQLAIIDNETPIAAWQKSNESGRLAASVRSAANRPRNRKMAQEFLKRRGKGLSNTALMAAIGAKEKLKRRASVNAIKSGLRDLKNCAALPR